MTSAPFRQLHGVGGRFTEGNQGILWTGIRAMANNINRRGKTLNTARMKAMDKLGDEMEAYAKSNAPWKDRTTDAREGLHTVVVHDKRREESTIWLAHGVGYGIWLETMQGGAFAIIMPTIQEFSKRVFSTVVEFDTADDVFERIYG